MEDGERVALMGSGSGKTTVLNIWEGLTRITGGRCRWMENCSVIWVTGSSPAIGNRSIGFVFQNFQLLEHLSVRDNNMSSAVLRQDDGGTVEAANSRVP